MVKTIEKVCNCVLEWVIPSLFDLKKTPIDTKFFKKLHLLILKCLNFLFNFIS